VDLGADADADADADVDAGPDLTECPVGSEGCPCGVGCAIGMICVDGLCRGPGADADADAGDAPPVCTQTLCTMNSPVCCPLADDHCVWNSITDRQSCIRVPDAGADVVPD
jgi:hypothetical protein